MAHDSSSSGGNMFNPYTEFKEFDRKQIQHYQKMFKHYDTNKDQYIDMDELSSLAEKSRSPQTIQQITEMIKEVDEDDDGLISFREFLLMFRKGKNNQLVHDGWKKIYKQIHVDTS